MRRWFPWHSERTARSTVCGRWGGRAVLITIDKATGLGSVRDTLGIADITAIARRTDTTTSGVAVDWTTPGEYSLEQNYPNPFNPTTEIRYQVSGVSSVKLVVYDLLGREVAVLVDEVKMPGRYEVRFDAIFNTSSRNARR